MSHLISDNVHVVENDQGAINAAYQVADFALEGRNERDQKRLLPFAEMDLFSAKGLGGIRIPQKFGGAFVSNKTFAHVFRILNKADSSVGQIPQNQIALLNMINIMGTEQQKTFIFNEIFSVHDKFHRTLILSGFCFLKIAKISLNSSFFPKPIKR